MKYFVTTYRVIYGDVDAMRVVYYANYLRWFEIGRTELMRHLGVSYAEVEERGFLLPVTEAYCKYIKSAFYDDMVLINTGIGFIRKASVRFDYRILNQQNDLLVQGYTIHACLDKKKKMVRIPEAIHSLLEKWD
jgi:acyl-CoA thioester hydrolase